MTSPSIRTVAAASLTREQLAAWAEIQTENRLLDSPYFRPEFTQAVAAVRDDVEVAIVERASEPVAFFPFQRTNWNAGRPVGGCLSDFQAVIARPGFSCDPLALLAACGLSSWRFDHLLSTESAFAPFVWRMAESPYVDLSAGYDAYAAQLPNSHKYLVEPARRYRKLEREFGPIRFAAHVCQGSILDTMIHWKTAQYERTHAQNIFKFPWTKKLLHRLLDHRQESFAPLMSVLYAGDQVAAVNYAMRSGDVLHCWFPAYNQDMRQSSPGILLYLEIFKAAAGLGINRIDFGKGEEPYKRKYMNGVALVAEGTVDARPAAALCRRALRWTRDRIRSSPLYTPARAPARAVKNVVAWLEHH